MRAALPVCWVSGIAAIAVRRALEGQTVNPAETPEGQRWMWLIAGLLVSLSIVIMLVATGV